MAKISKTPIVDRLQRLHQDADFLATLFDELVGYAILVVDFDGTILTFNEGAVQIFGYKPEEVIGKLALETFFPPAFLQAEYLDQITAMLLSFGRFAYDGDLVRHNGQEFPAHLLFTLARDHGGAIIGTILLAEDLTERKRAAQLLEERTRQLEELNRYLCEAKEQVDQASQAKSEFLSRMSHELRTPLNAVLGFAQLLQMDNLNPGQIECVQQILKGGKHLLNLINEILDLARIEAGRMTISPEPVNVGAAVQESLELVGPLAVGHQIQLKVEWADLEGAYVLADHQRLKQVLLNLLSNAIKYNRQGGSVTVSCAEAPGNRLCLAVNDTGAGLTAEQLGRLFKPFERLGVEARDIEGTGLGLSLARGLVEAMGGTVAANSSPGRGSTFTVELGRTSRPSTFDKLLAPGVIGVGATSPCQGTILYVEDNLSNSRLMERLLERWPHVRLLTALQGSMGLELARQHRPDLVLLDLHLPDMPGEEVLQRLHAELGPVPVIVVSADATSRQINRLLGLGAHDYLTKPLDVQRFLTIISRVLQHRPEQANPAS